MPSELPSTDGFAGSGTGPRPNGTGSIADRAALGTAGDQAVPAGTEVVDDAQRSHERE